MSKKEIKTEKPTFKQQLSKIVLDNLKIALLTLASGGYIGYKEYTQEGKDEALKAEMTEIMDRDMKEALDEARTANFLENMDKALQDPKVWQAILSSGFIESFTMSEKRAIREEFDKKIAEVDSSSKASVNIIGKIGGFRNDEFEVTLGRMMKDYLKKNSPRVLELDAF